MRNGVAVSNLDYLKEVNTEAYERIVRATRADLGLITEDELAAALDVKTNTLQVWRSNGEGPAYVKLGKSVFYRPSDVSSWATTNTHKPQPKV